MKYILHYYEILKKQPQIEAGVPQLLCYGAVTTHTAEVQSTQQEAHNVSYK